MMERLSRIAKAIFFGKRRFAHDRQIASSAFSSDGKRLASAGWDDTIRIWEVLSDKDLHWTARIALALNDTMVAVCDLDSIGTAARGGTNRE